MVLKENYKKLLKEVSNKFVNLQVNPYGEVEIDLSKYGENQEELIKVLEKWQYEVSKMIDKHTVALKYREKLDFFKHRIDEFQEYVQNQMKEKEEIIVENINWEYLFNSFEVIAIVESMGLQCKIEKTYKNIYHAIITTKKNIINKEYFNYDHYGKILLYDHYANIDNENKLLQFSYYDYDLTHGIDFEEFGLSYDASYILEELIGSQYAYKVQFLVCEEFPSNNLMEKYDWDFIITSVDNIDIIEDISKWAEKNNKIFFISKYPYRESLYTYQNTLSFPLSYNNIANFSAEKLALDLSISFKYRNWKNIQSLSQYYRMNNGEFLYDALKRNISKSRFGYVGTL